VDLREFQPQTACRARGNQPQQLSLQFLNRASLNSHRFSIRVFRVRLLTFSRAVKTGLLHVNRAFGDVPWGRPQLGAGPEEKMTFDRTYG